MNETDCLTIAILLSAAGLGFTFGDLVSKAYYWYTDDRS